MTAIDKKQTLAGYIWLRAGNSQTDSQTHSGDPGIIREVGAGRESGDEIRTVVGAGWSTLT